MTLNEKINSRRAGTFATWAKSRALFAKVKAACESGKTVHFSTYTHTIPVKAKHIAEGMIKAGQKGLYVQRGKRWDFLGGCKITVS